MNSRIRFILFTVLIVGEAWKQIAPWWWPKTDCTILSSRVGETGNDNNPYRRIELLRSLLNTLELERRISLT